LHTLETGSGRIYSREKNIAARGNKTRRCRFTLVGVPEKSVTTESFAELALPLLDRLYNFAQWLTQDRGEAEDLVQETYAKALRGFASFQRGTNFRAWMYQILRNTFLTSRTGLKAAAMVPIDSAGDEETLAVTESTPESILLERLDRERVQRALDALPVQHREILLLAEFEEMSYQEIASTLGVPLGTVMSRLSRARRALKTIVQGAQRS